MISREQLGTILKEADPEGIITSGAPPDEYDPETDLILQLLYCKGVESVEAEEVEDIVRRVWARLLGPFSAEDLVARQAVFRKIANEIVATYKPEKV